MNQTLTKVWGDILAIFSDDFVIRSGLGIHQDVRSILLRRLWVVTDEDYDGSRSLGVKHR